MSSYQRSFDRLKRDWQQICNLGFYVFFFIVLAFCAGLLFYHSWLKLKAPATNSEKQYILLLEKQQQEIQTDLATTELELSLAKQANADMKQIFAEQIQKQQTLEHELAFYRSVMAPEDNAEGVALHGIELEMGLIANQYRLKLILTQLKKLKRFINGEVQINLIGKLDEKPKVMSLEALTKQKMKFSYRYFTTLETSFILPDDFELDRLEVNVIVPRSRQRKGAQSKQVFNAAELLGEKDNGVILEQNTQLTDNSRQ